jgi:hypothetical protein
LLVVVAPKVFPSTKEGHAPAEDAKCERQTDRDRGIVVTPKSDLRTFRRALQETGRNLPLRLVSMSPNCVDVHAVLLAEDIHNAR